MIVISDFHNFIQSIIMSKKGTFKKVLRNKPKWGLYSDAVGHCTVRVC